MDQTEFRCETCGSPHVSIPEDPKPQSAVLCGNCGKAIASWGDYRSAISLCIANDQRFDHGVASALQH